MKNQKKWRLIDRINTNGAMQMAIDEAITIACSKGKSQPTLRFYTFNPPTITIGHAQNISNFNLDKINKKGFDYVRRITGGTAVLHKNDLVYALIIPENFLPNKIIDAYNYLSEGLVYGLNNLGLKAYKRVSKSKIRKDCCYLNDNPYDIVLNNKKISGNAQSRINQITLQHGTIIVENNLNELFDCLNGNHETIQNMFDQSKKKITSIQEAINKPKSLNQIEQAMEKGFKELFIKKNIEFEKSKLSNYELELANKLYKEKYSNNEWNN
ncbi:MAG: lipoate--protein ligase family protein [Nanoarchaeota archaeon]